MSTYTNKITIQLQRYKKYSKNTNIILFPVLIHLSPALSTVDEDKAGRPAKVDVSDLSETRSKTGLNPFNQV